MNWTAKKPDKSRANRKFDAAHLIANSAISSLGAGAAMAAASGAVLPILAAAAIGAWLGYSITNNIPKNGN